MVSRYGRQQSRGKSDAPTAAHLLVPALETFGTSGRNILIRPGMQNLDASLASSNFRRITAAGNPRIMQLAGKFYF